MSIKRRCIVVVALVAIATTSWAAALASAGTRSTSSPVGPGALTSANSSMVTIVHGLRGQLVDVYLDGTVLLPAFQPDRLTDPTPVAAGPHTVALRPAGSPAGSTPKASQAITVPAGKSLSIVAHFDASGGWAMTVYTNDLSHLTGGQGRVVFRNTSAVAPVAVHLNGAPTATLGPAVESSQVVAAASYAVVALSGTDSSTLVPSNTVAVAAGADTVLYLVGQGHDVTWLTQQITGLDTAPALVPTGNSGLASPNGNQHHGLWLLGALSLGAATLMTTSRRRRRPAV
jgi:hypothetical protein